MVDPNKFIPGKQPNNNNTPEGPHKPTARKKWGDVKTPYLKGNTAKPPTDQKPKVPFSGAGTNSIRAVSAPSPKEDSYAQIVEELAAASNEFRVDDSPTDILLKLAEHYGEVQNVFKEQPQKLSNFLDAIAAKIPEGLGAQDNNHDTALLWAASKGHTDIALALIDKMNPKDLAIQDNNGDTALLWAASLGHTDIALALIGKMNPKNLSIQENNGDTALHLAASLGHTDIAVALIGKMNPEDLAIQNNNGWTALKSAANLGYTDIALALIKKMTPDQLAIKKNDGDTDLHSALSLGHTDIALALIDKMNPKNLSIQENNGLTALHLAASKGHTEIAVALIRKMDSNVIHEVLMGNKYGLFAMKNKEILNVFLTKGLYPLSHFKELLFNFMNLEVKDGKKYHGFSSQYIVDETRDNLFSFFNQTTINADKKNLIESILSNSYCEDNQAIIENLDGMISCNTDNLVACYCTIGKTPTNGGHQTALIKIKGKYYLLNEGYGSPWVNEKAAGVIEVSEDFIKGLIKHINEDETMEEVCAFIEEEAQQAIDNGKLIRATDPQWIGNCPVATMRLLLREIFKAYGLEDLFKEFSLFQRIEIIKLFQEVLAHFPQEVQKIETPILRMAQAKALHLCFKRKSFPEIIAIVTKDFNTPNNEAALRAFFKECLDNPELPYDDDPNIAAHIAAHIAELKGKHKTDYKQAMDGLDQMYKKPNPSQGRPLPKPGAATSKQPRPLPTPPKKAGGGSGNVQTLIDRFQSGG